MLWFLSALVGAASLAALVIGVVALLNNPARTQNRWFFIFTTILACWMVFNFIDSNVANQLVAALFLKLDLIFALFLAWTFIEFVTAFEIGGKSKMHPIVKSKLILRMIPAVINIIFSALVLSGEVFKVAGTSDQVSITYSGLFILDTAVVISYFIIGFSVLLYKRHVAHGSSKSGLGLIFSGLSIAAVTNIFTNVVFPLVLPNHEVVSELNIVGYIGLAVMVLLVYLSITLQHLLDIRLIVVRALAYLSALLSVAACFTAITVIVTLLLLNRGTSVIAERVIYALLAVVLAVAFPWIKKSFDRLTDKLFYQDAYDPQIFLSGLNQVFATTFEIKHLLRECVETIVVNMKVEFCMVAIKASSSGTIAVGTSAHELNLNDIMRLNPADFNNLSNVILTDYLPAESQRLGDILSRNNISALVRLKTEPSLSKSGFEVGYMLLGQKRSGNTYTTQDLRLLGIIGNELVIAAQNALRLDEIQRFNITLQEEVDTATRKLRRQNKRLEELDNIKDDFISMASHQLRTPLTSVKGYISMVLEGDAGKLNSTQTQMLKQAFASSQRMVFLITDLLNVSRLKTGKFIIDAAPMRLDEVVAQELEQLRETAQVKNIEISYYKPKSFPELMLDEVKIRQVLMNFVDNAIYYTPDGGHIKVELAEKPSTVEFRVTDDGIGVPKSEQHHLFTKFYRATNARKARPDGTGLGLFMAQKVIVAQGGSVIFSSVENKGSTFGFSFSKARLAVPAKPANTTASKAALTVKEPAAK